MQMAHLHVHYALAAGDLAGRRVGEAVHESPFALELIGDDLAAFSTIAHTQPNQLIDVTRRTVGRSDSTQEHKRTG